MLRFDEVLIDPPDRVLLNAISKARRRANAEWSKLDRDRSFWQQFIARAKRPEGAQAWRGGRSQYNEARLDLAWWTDPLGRRHWRVRGGWSGRAPKALPPLVWVYPEVFLARRNDKPPIWQAICPECGVTGLPAALGWMGTRCGPCHDRRQEDGPSASLPPRLGTGDDYLVPAICFLADGSLLASALRGDVLRWSAPNFAPERVYRASAWHNLTTVGPAGTFVRLRHRPYGLFWYEPGTATPHHIPLPNGAAASRLFSPDGTRLLVSNRQGNPPAYLVSLREGVTQPGGPEDFTVRPLPGVRPEFGEWVFEPDGRGVLGRTRASTIRRWDLDTGASQEWPCAPINLLWHEDSDWPYALAVSRTWLAGYCPQAPQPLHVMHRPSGKWSGLPVPADALRPRIIFDPEGEFLVSGDRDCLILWDMNDPQKMIYYQQPQVWEPLYRHSLAFSPDGATLAAGMNNGTICCWPWPALRAGLK